MPYMKLNLTIVDARNDLCSSTCIPDISIKCLHLCVEQIFCVMCLSTNSYTELHIALSVASVIDMCDNWLFT
jgi:hypothetical protein